MVFIIGDGSCSCLELADIMGGNEGFVVGGRKFVGDFSERKNGIESEGKFTRASKMGDGKRRVGAMITSVCEHKNCHMPILCQVAKLVKNALRTLGKLGRENVRDVVDNNHRCAVDEDCVLNGLKFLLDSVRGRVGCVEAEPNIADISVVANECFFFGGVA